MNIQISIKKIGHATGTIGWLAENADSITIGKTKDGNPAAWLKDKQGKTLTILAIGGEYGDGSKDGIATVTRMEYGMTWPGSCDFYTTDAAWEVVKDLAKIARQHMAESAELADGYKISVAVAA